VRRRTPPPWAKPAAEAPKTLLDIPATAEPEPAPPVVNYECPEPEIDPDENPPHEPTKAQAQEFADMLETGIVPTEAPMTPLEESLNAIAAMIDAPEEEPKADELPPPTITESIDALAAIIAEPEEAPKPEPIAYLLPTNLASLATCAAKNSTRYAMTGVKVDIEADKIHMVATNSKLLLKVTVPANLVPSEDEKYQIRNKPNGAKTGLVPAKEWKDTFTACHKLKRAKIQDKEVALRLAPNSASFESIGMNGNLLQEHTHVEGRFPPYEDVLREDDKAEVLTEVTFDIGYLTTVLDAIAKMWPDDYGKPVVTMRLQRRKADDPRQYLAVQLRAKAKDVVFEGCVMPLS
jgi:hypothetical protein